MSREMMMMMMIEVRQLLSYNLITPLHLFLFQHHGLQMA